MLSVITLIAMQSSVHNGAYACAVRTYIGRTDGATSRAVAPDTTSAEVVLTLALWAMPGNLDLKVSYNSAGGFWEERLCCCEVRLALEIVEAS
jgi:hypothetical protein